MVKGTTLRNIGTSQGVIIPRTILEQVSFGQDSKLIMTTHGNNIVISAASPKLIKSMPLIESLFVKHASLLADMKD